MRALAHSEARDAEREDSALAVLKAVAADLRLCGHVTRETIRRVCSAVTPTTTREPGEPSGSSGREESL